jgi:arylsulfatase
MLMLNLAVVGLIAAGTYAAERPNIIFIMTDDQGYAPIGRHGHPWIRTPHLDDLYDASMRFTRFLVSPTCAPTRAALMSGRHPMKNGVSHTILERERMSLETVTVAEILRDAGYATGVFGKWHLGDEAPYRPHQRGFSESFIHGAGGIGQKFGGKRQCSCADAPGNGYFNPVILHNEKFVKTNGYCTDVFFTQALGWIRTQQKADTPFFAYLATNAPHGPFIAPEKNYTWFKALGFADKPAGFYGMIENIDENMGRLIAKLDAWGLLENTVIIFTSDNGMAGHSGEPGKTLGTRPDGTPMMYYNAGMKGRKNSPDEGGVRTPFLVRWDGHVKAGHDVDTVTAHIDVMPTLAELAGAKLPDEQVEGRSLVPLMVNPQVPWPDRFLITHVGRWPVDADPEKYKYRGFAVRNQRYRLVNQTSLFDMEADPGQTTNVIDRHPEVAKAMMAAFDSFWENTRPLLVNEQVSMSQTWPFHELFNQQTAAGGIPAWVEPDLE